MYQFILFIHVFAAVCIVALVLVQQGKGASLGAAFGSGASQTIFGSRGSGSFLFRLTGGFVAAFFITSISLNYITMHAYKQARVITLPAVPSHSAGSAQKSNTQKPSQQTTGNTSPAPGEIPTRK